MRQLSHKVAELRALQRQYEQFIPASLVRASRVMHLEQKTLTISADNGAVASKLQQLTPALAESFQTNGFEITVIQVRVQVASSPAPCRSSPATVSIAARQRLVALAEKLPDSPLKKALQRLATSKSG